MSTSTIIGRRLVSTVAWMAAVLLLGSGNGAQGTEHGASKQGAAGVAGEASHAPGTIIRDCDECPELVVVPAGTFRMGDLTGGGDVDEAPVRTVTIPRPFAMARFETTFTQWDACVAAGACRQGVGDIGFGRGRRPAMLVSFEDAETYAGWLSQRTGQAYRLPSESEWEYAARAGSATRFPWGDDIGRGNANCDECGSRWDDERTAPVGSFPANAFSVHDMVGNLYEWVADCGGESYAGTPSDGSAAGPEDDGCNWRMMRGGSWLSLPRASRPANRVRVPIVFQDINTGFRVAKDLF